LATSPTSTARSPWCSRLKRCADLHIAAAHARAGRLPLAVAARASSRLLCSAALGCGARERACANCRSWSPQESRARHSRPALTAPARPVRAALQRCKLARCQRCAVARLAVLTPHAGCTTDRACAGPGGGACAGRAAPGPAQPARLLRVGRCALGPCSAFPPLSQRRGCLAARSAPTPARGVQSRARYAAARRPRSSTSMRRTSATCWPARRMCMRSWTACSSQRCAACGRAGARPAPAAASCAEALRDRACLTSAHPVLSGPLQRAVGAAPACREPRARRLTRRGRRAAEAAAVDLLHEHRADGHHAVDARHPRGLARRGRPGPPRSPQPCPGRASWQAPRGACAHSPRASCGRAGGGPRPRLAAPCLTWPTGAAQEYKLVADTLFLAVSYLDRYLSLRCVPRARLQLVGITCMLLAAKYEEIYAPQARPPGPPAPWPPRPGLPWGAGASLPTCLPARAAPRCEAARYATASGQARRCGRLSAGGGARADRGVLLHHRQHVHARRDPGDGGGGAGRAALRADRAHAACLPAPPGQGRARARAGRSAVRTPPGRRPCEAEGGCFAGL
jgi:hypothetical protein